MARKEKFEKNLHSCKMPGEMGKSLIIEAITSS
jgi:hypothetical protein